MTKREFLTAIANGEINSDLSTFAADEITKMDNANEKRKNKPSKKSVENAPIVEAIYAVLTSEGQTASDIATAVGISTQKASALLRGLVADGRAVATDVKVPKHGTCKAYALAD